MGEEGGKRVENVLARQERQARPAFLPFCTYGEKDNCHLNPLYEKYTKYFEITRVAPLKIQKSITHKFKPLVFESSVGTGSNGCFCHSSRTRIFSQGSRWGCSSMKAVDDNFFSLGRGRCSSPNENQCNIKHCTGAFEPLSTSMTMNYDFLPQPNLHSMCESHSDVLLGISIQVDFFKSSSWGMGHT